MSEATALAKSGAEVNAQKTVFARELLRDPANPQAAAFAAFPLDTGAALQVALAWPKDDFVKLEMIRLLSEEGQASFLPSKDQQAKDIYQIATSSRDEEIRLKAHRLYAELRGYIEKPAAASVTFAQTTNVMVVKDHGNDDNWETIAKAQQAKLIEGSSASASA